MGSAPFSVLLHGLVFETVTFTGEVNRAIAVMETAHPMSTGALAKIEIALDGAAWVQAGWD
jgi:hypothetical protein